MVSQWDLVDIPCGRLLEHVIAAKPSMPTIAFVNAGDEAQEVAARSLGVKAVLEDDVDDAYFRDTVRQLLGIESISRMQVSDPYNDGIDELYSVVL